MLRPPVPGAREIEGPSHDEDELERDGDAGEPDTRSEQAEAARAPGPGGAPDVPPLAG